MAEARNTVEKQLRKRYLDRGPLMSINLGVLVGMASRGRLAVPDGDATVEDAVTSVLLEGKVLGRYRTSDDFRVWVAPEYGWDLVCAADADLVCLATAWRNAPGRTHQSMRSSIIEDHIRDIVRHVTSERLADVERVLPVALWLLTGASKVELYKATKLLQGMPAGPLASLVREMLERDETEMTAVELADTFAAILAPAG